MAERSFFTGEEVLQLLDVDGEDGGLNDTFFPGSDEELEFLEDESDTDERQVNIYLQDTILDRV